MARLLTFVLNGIVFVLIGVQLPSVLAGIRNYSLQSLILAGALFALLVIALRLLWIYPSARLAWIIRTRILHHRVEPAPLRATSQSRTASPPIADGSVWLKKVPITLKRIACLVSIGAPHSALISRHRSTPTKI